MKGSAATKLAVIDAFRRNRVSDGRVVAALVQALEGGPDILRAATLALGSIGPAAESAVPALERISRSLDPSFTPEEREETAQALRSIQTVGARN